MSILCGPNSRIIVQGLTGRYGSQQAKMMLEYGTNIVAGVSPGKNGASVHGIPVFDTVEEAVFQTNADTSIIYVPPLGVKDAAIEAIDSGIKLIMIATEYVPIKDIMLIRAYSMKQDSWIIGPNTAGLINPGEVSLGSVGPDFTQKGPVGIVTRSGSLINEITRYLSQHSLGQSTCVDIGGDLIIGRNIKDYLTLFEADNQTEVVVLLAEIGGKMEYEAGEYIKQMKKPVIAYIAGANVPQGKRMGHVGALVSEESESAHAKKQYLKECGAYVVETPWQIPAVIQKVTVTR